MFSHIDIKGFLSMLASFFIPPRPCKQEHIHPLHADSWDAVAVDSIGIGCRIFQPHVHCTDDVLSEVIKTVSHMMNFSIVRCHSFFGAHSRSKCGVVDAGFICFVNQFLRLHKVRHGYSRYVSSINRCLYQAVVLVSPSSTISIGCAVYDDTRRESVFLGVFDKSEAVEYWIISFEVPEFC